MTRPLIDRENLDHPEHFDDEIREYKSVARYRPTALEQMLFEMSGHRCTICSAPWLEIHHIIELANGGKTEYDNLIVLCPNCHTRVHAEGVPCKEELRHYKLKQEIAFELPVLSRLSKDERRLLNELASMESNALVTHLIGYISPRIAEANQKAQPDYTYLMECGILLFDSGTVMLDGDGKEHQVSGGLTMSYKGIRWIKYLAKTNRLPE